LPGIGGKRADKLWTVFGAQRGTRGAESKSQSAIAEALQTCASSVPKKAAAAWAQFAATIAQLEDESVRSSPAKMIRLVFDAGYEEYLQQHHTNYRLRQEDLDQLAGFSRQFSSTEEFLTQLVLLTNLEAEEDRPAPADTEQLRLSTIHQAKGLEFPVVFIIMLCDGLFPSARSMKTAEDKEEERRLFYVAITRAKNELYLSYPLVRFAQGKGGDAAQTPSRFLNEIPAELRDEWNLGLFNPYG